MKKLQKVINKSPLLALFICLTIILVGCFLPGIIAHVPLMYGTDIKPEQYFFVEELYNLMDAFFTKGKLPFYSWKMFLGTDYYSSMGFYGYADIYNLLGYTIKFIGFYDRTLILEIIKLYVAGFSMYGLLKQVGFKSESCIIGSLCYAFSGWAIFFSGQLMFLSVYSFIPLYFWGMERYLQTGKWGMYIATIPLIILTNWYFFYTVSLLSPLFYLYRYSMLHGNLKNSLKSIVKLILVYLVGVMIAGFYFVPTILYMENNDRVLSLSSSLLFEDWRVYFHLLVSSFVPNQMYIYGNNVLDTAQHYTREICMFSGGLMAVLLPQGFFFSDRKRRSNTRILFLILAVIMLIPFMDSAMHGFADPSFRWLCVYIIFVILTGCTVLENIEQLDNKKLWKFTWIEVILCISIIPLVCFLGKSPLEDYLLQYSCFIFGALVLIAYTIVITGKKECSITRLIVCVTIELFTWNTCFYIGQANTTPETHSYLFNYRATHVLQTQNNQLNTYLDSLDEENSQSYYRVYLPQDSICWNYSHNMQIAYQLNGLMEYCSTYEPSFNDMKQLVPEVKDFESEFLFNIRDGQVMSFLNTKYAIVVKETELPEGTEWELVDGAYLDAFRVYENLNYRDFGTTYAKVMTKEMYMNSRETERFNDTIICDTEDLITIESEVSNEQVILKDITYHDNYLYGTYTSTQDGYMVLGIPFNRGWSIQIDGQQVTSNKVNGGFTGLSIPAGTHEVQMYFMPVGLKMGVIVSGIAFVLLFVWWLIAKQRRS